MNQTDVKRDAIADHPDLCPWCDGTGMYWSTWQARVKCTQCDGTGDKRCSQR